MSSSLKLKIPNHIAIIMDGNARWAKLNNKPAEFGHKKGASGVEEVIKSCAEFGVKYLTLYAFSSENWNRPQQEVLYLMDLLKLYLKTKLNILHKNNVKLNIIGDRSILDDEINKYIIEAEELTKNNKALNLLIALNYGSKQEIVNATKNIVSKVRKGEIELNDIDEKLFDNYLYTAKVPAPDLLIRTSGEQRLSNFLLWQLAYAEFYFTKTLWPDFNRDSLYDAILDYNKRDRRYGSTH